MKDVGLGSNETYDNWRFFHSENLHILQNFLSHLLVDWIRKKCRFISSRKSDRSAIDLMHTSKLLNILGKEITGCLESLADLVNSTWKSKCCCRK